MIKSLKYFVLSVVCLLPLRAKADFCVKVETSQPVWVSAECGFDLIGKYFNSSEHSVDPHREICRSNKLLFVPLPCTFTVKNLDKSKVCNGGPLPYYNSTTIRDDVFGGERQSSTYCVTH